MECAPRTGEVFSQVEYRPFSGFKFRNAGFKLDRRNISDRRVKAFPVINFLDKKWKSFRDVLVSFVIPKMNLLVLECFIEGFHERVVVRIPFGRHADFQSVLLKQADIGR